MPTYEPLDWYQTPLYYDIVFEEDTQKEGDFLTTALERFGRVKSRKPFRLLEPACGSGRLVEEMARRGFAVTGFDLSQEMLDFARRRLEQAGLDATLKVARMEDFHFRGKFALAHCLVSTFKYLLDETSARSHLECVAQALERGGIYVLGFHLTSYDWPFAQHERWVGRRDGVEVVCNIHSWPPEFAKRRERVRSRLVVEEKGRQRRTETSWWFRTYDAAQARRLIRSVPAFEHVATYDFCYDWTRPRALDDEQLDTLLVLRKR